MIGLLLLLPLLLATGCSLSCSEIGCRDEAEISYSRELPMGTYEFAIETPDGSASCTFIIDEETWEQDCTGSLTDVRLEARAAFVGGTPATVQIEITRDDETIASDSLDLDYESRQPNGSGCPPVCQVAEADLVVSH